MSASGAAPAAAAAVRPGASPLASVDAIGSLWDESVAWIGSRFVQVLVATAIATMLVLAMLAVRAYAERFCRNSRWSAHWPATLAKVVAHTRPWFMVPAAGKLVDGYADPPALVAQTINVLFTVAAALQAALWVRELILGVVESRAGGEEPHGRLGSAIELIRLLVTVVLFAIAAVAILDNLGVNVTGLIAGLGIGGIAIGLAAKGIFDDLFSALSIIFDRPFVRGDAISWDKTSGTVEAIGLKTTRVRAVSGEEVVISNTNLLAKEIHNLARLDRRRIVLALGVGYYTPPEVCRGLPAMLKDIVEARDRCTMVRCGLVGFGASTIDFELQFDVRSDRYDEVFTARHEVGVAILRAFGEAGIDLAFPTQVSVQGRPDGRPYVDGAMILPPPRPDADDGRARPGAAELAPE